MKTYLPLLAICLYINCVVGFTIDVKLGTSTLLASHAVVMQDLYKEGEVKGIAFAAFNVTGLAEKQNNNLSLYYYMIRNQSTIELNVYYGSDCISTTDVQPMLNTNDSPNTMGFTFKFTRVPYPEATMSIRLVDKSAFPGYYKESTSQMIFFSHVENKADLITLDREINAKRIFFIKLSNSSDKEIDIRNVTCSTVIISGSEGKALIATFDPMVEVYSISKSIEPIKQLAYINSKENYLTIEVEKVDVMEALLAKHVWLHVMYIRDTCNKFTIIPTEVTNDKLSNEQLIIKLKYNSHVSQPHPKTEVDDSPETGVEIVFQTIYIESRTQAFLYKGRKTIEIYLKENEVQAMQDYLSTNIIGYYKSNEESPQFVIPSDTTIVMASTNPAYAYLCFHYEGGIFVTIGGKKNRFLATMRTTEFEIYGEAKTLAFLVTITKGYKWTVELNNSTKIIVNPTVKGGQLGTRKDCPILTITYSALRDS